MDVGRGGGKSAEIKEGKKKNQHKRAASIGRRKSHLLRRTPWPWDVGTNKREELMQAQFGTASTPCLSKHARRIMR